MAEAKKARAKNTRSTGAKSASKQAPAQDAVSTLPADPGTEATLFSREEALTVPPSASAKAPLLPHADGEVLRQAVSEAVVASARGALDLNDKIIEALQTQSDAAIELWRTTLSAPRLSDAIRVQTTGARQVYETASAQWTDIADATARWFSQSIKPFQTALHGQNR